ncbi:uncharacterized protein [Zea mays]|uniref:uncharacterized protein isoform X2 n=1 Tax=Zea mays TaxID=4577 RepID=UPI0004DEB0D0|nr:uncharacterized protein LOC103640536 isoform X2 [Zea mays]|eukprot:XP_008661723.1 uncharacterized protein LOC103640536 isoform X2 [Zea mays]
MCMTKSLDKAKCWGNRTAALNASAALVRPTRSVRRRSRFIYPTANKVCDRRGGNAAGHVARMFFEHDMADGRLCNGVEAPFLIHVGAEDHQRPELLQALEGKQAVKY